jgi:hypothetical protein
MQEGKKEGRRKIEVREEIWRKKGRKEIKEKGIAANLQQSHSIRILDYYVSSNEPTGPEIEIYEIFSFSFAFNCF